MNEHLSQKQKSQLLSVLGDRATDADDLDAVARAMFDRRAYDTAVDDAGRGCRREVPSALRSTEGSVNPQYKTWEDARAACGKPRCRCACKDNTGDANHA